MKNLGEIIKSPADKKKYRAVELDNGLKVLLISQPVAGDEKVSSAASMVVEAGCFHEPRGVAGLAHFCEHLLFMGTKKYPDENHFEEFIGRFGGFSNASTHDSFTRYYFELMDKNEFKEALDIWAQFFVDPLMKKDTVQREINAVDSEFDLARQNDWCRKLFIMQEALMVKGHPEQQNGWGNTKLIIETPKQNGLDSYEVLKHWYPLHYSSKWMSLCIQSPLPLDTLEDIVTEIFNAVPKRPGLEQPLTNPFHGVGSAFKPCEKPQLVRCVPVEDEISLDLWFWLPTVISEYLVCPAAVPSYLIGHEGIGSILEKLKAEGLATELCIHSDDHTKLSSRAEISVRLTQAGFEKWSYVWQTIFVYIKMLQDMSDADLLRIFEEVQNIRKAAWACKEENTPSSNVTGYSEAMTVYPVNRWILKSKIIEEYSPEKIRAYIQSFTPSNCTTFLSSKTFETLELRTEALTGAKYIVEDVNVTINHDITGLYLPAKNRYVATDFKLKEGEEQTWKHPQKLSETENGELWFKGDDKFKLPRGKIGFEFRHPPSSNQSLINLYNKIFCLKLSTKVYDAEAAGLDYTINGGFSSRGSNFELGYRLGISVLGFNEKLGLLLSEILNEIEGLKITETEFANAKKEQLEDYNNALIKPRRLAIDVCSTLIVKNFQSLFKMVADLKALTFERFENERINMWSSCYAQCHIQGNFTKEEAIHIYESSLHKLKCTGVRDYIAEPVIKITPDPVCLKLENFNKTDGNSYVICHYQYGNTTLEEKCRLSLLGWLSSDPAFDFLRTKNTLGYVCFSMVPRAGNYYAFSLNVGSQREKFTVENVYSKMLEFNAFFLHRLKTMSEADFDNYKGSLVQSLVKAPTNLGKLFSTHNTAILKAHYEFDRKAKKAKIIETLTKMEIIKLYEQKVIKNKNVILITVEGIESSKQQDAQIFELRNLTLSGHNIEQIKDLGNLSSRL